MLLEDGRCRRKRSWMPHTLVRCGLAVLQDELYECRTERRECGQCSICIDYGYVSLHGWHGRQWADFTQQQLRKEVELSQSNEMKTIKCGHNYFLE